MRGSVFKQCWCRDPATGLKLHSRCPDLKKKGHGSWYARYEERHSPGERRRQPMLGPFKTKTEAEEELAAVLARVGGGSSAPDRSLRISAYLAAYLAGKRDLKPRSRATDAEAFRLYWIPALGQERLVDVRDHHVSDVITAMENLNRPLTGKLPGPVSEILRRMDAARADDERRALPEGDTRRKKARKPLSAARIERMFAPFRAAMNAAVKTKKLQASPCDGVHLPHARKPKPLAWTPPREAAFRAALDKRARDAGDLTAVQRQAHWAAADLRPCPVMVWLPEHTGRFLEAVSAERLYALFCLAAFCGLRRDELTGLLWADTDLDERVATIRKTGTGSGTKSEHGDRVVPLPEAAVRALRSWRKIQAASRLSWGETYEDNGLVFTREDGTPVPGQWVSVRFETLAWRAGLPPVRFHDLRHGAASLLKGAGYDTKFISAILGHSRTSFTDATYVLLFPDVARAAMDDAAALVPGAER